MLGTMTKRRRMLGLVAVVAMGLTGYAGWLVLTLPVCQLSLRGLDRIQPGMTQAEVEAILGAPPGEYCTGALICASWGNDPLHFGWNGPGYVDQTWTGDDGILKVRFRPDGTVAPEPVTAKAMIRFQPGVILPPPTLFDRLRGWLGW
jgi:hypothetical protein